MCLRRRQSFLWKLASTAWKSSSVCSLPRHHPFASVSIPSRAFSPYQRRFFSAGVSSAVDPKPNEKKERYVGLKQATEEEKRKVKEAASNFMPSSRADKFAVHLFLEAGQFEGAIEAVWQDIERLDHMITTDLSFAKVFKDEMPEYIRKKAVQTIVIDFKFHPIVARALELLAETKSVTLVPPFYLPFKRLVDRYFKRVPVTIFYAPTKDITEDYLKHLVATIRSRFPADTRPELTVKADSKLIKGYRVYVAATVYLDTSLATQIDQMAQKYLAQLTMHVSYLSRIKSERATLPLDLAAMNKQVWDWVFESMTLDLPSEGKKKAEAGIQEEVTERMRTLQSVYNYVIKN